MNYHYDFTGTDRNGNAVTGDIIAKIRYKITCDVGGIGMDPTYDPDQEMSIKIVPPTTELSLAKYVNPGAVPPGGVVEYTLSWDLNETGSSSPPVNPIFTDLLPIGMDYVVGSAKQGNNTGAGSGGPLPATEEVILNYLGTGRTLVRWKFTGIYGQFANNGGEAIRFNAKVRAGTQVGIQDNTFNVSSNDQITSSKFSWPGSGKELTDTQDLDGDGSSTDIIVTSEKATLNVVELATLESYKWVKGSLDPSENRYPITGRTTRGGTADYRLIVRNLGNITMKNVVVYDILPHIGDKAVIGTQDRLTAWRPNLLSTVSFVPNDPNIKVYYSQQTNPCRPEVYSSAGCVNDWTLTPPADLATVQALKFDFGTMNIPGGDSIQLSWQMKAPVDAPTSGEIAWNSFAYSTTRVDNNVVLAPSEPVKVGISVEPPPASASVGDYVFKDLNTDNIQNGTETGINGVKVEIFKSDGSVVTDIFGAPVTATYTSNNSSGQPGYYNFVLLPQGSYKIIFTNPDPTTCSIQSGANASTGETAIFTLANNDNKTDVDLVLAPSCVPPNGIYFNTTSQTCFGATANNDGKITLTSATNADKYGISSGVTYIGAPYASATSLPALPLDVQTMIPNSGATYTLRLYNGTNDCYKDTTIVIFARNCATPCGTMTATAVPAVCTPSTNLYDVSGEVSFTSTPVSGTLTISNSGGGSVTFNAPFTSPMAYTIPNLVSNGATNTITAVFSEDPTFCTESVDYTAPASCNSLPCPPKVCLPITVTRN
jgi:uncharacterized repeat protein (TIGR01451 family)